MPEERHMINPEQLHVTKGVGLSFQVLALTFQLVRIEMTRVSLNETE